MSYSQNAFTISEIIGDEKTLEFKLKLFGMKYTKDNTAIIPTNSKGCKYHISMKILNKILNGKPITDLKVFESIRTIKIDEQ